MSRVEEIERAIQELTPDEFAQIARHVHAVEQQRWDEQLDRDAAAGKLDALLEGRAKKAGAIPDEAIDGVIDEAVDRVRHRTG